MVNSIEAANEVLSRWDLDPQQFPIYYAFGTRSFLNAAGQPSGAAGSVARLTRDLSNFPHMFLGIRISNTYQLPETMSADDVQLVRLLKEHIDGEQTVRIELAQQNITADAILQKQLVGGLDGAIWHPFPAPFPMAGANNIAVEITRRTSYPLLGEQEILPVVDVSILAGVFRGDLATSAVHRMKGR